MKKKMAAFLAVSMLLCGQALAADFSNLVIIHTNDTHGFDRRAGGINGMATLSAPRFFTMNSKRSFGQYCVAIEVSIHTFFPARNSATSTHCSCPPRCATTIFAPSNLSASAANLRGLLL